jgi:hypothetical protein
VELFEGIRRGYAAGGAIQGLSKKHGVGGSVPALPVPGPAQRSHTPEASVLRFRHYGSDCYREARSSSRVDLPTVDQLLSRRT